MEQKLIALKKGLELFLLREITSNEIINKLNTPIIIDDDFDDMDDNIGSIVYEIDTWGMNRSLTDDDIKEYIKEISEYLQSTQK